jgi:hypothetical protein
MNPLIRELPNGWTLEVCPLTFARGRLNVTRNPNDVGKYYDDNW